MILQFLVLIGCKKDKTDTDPSKCDTVIGFIDSAVINENGPSSHSILDIDFDCNGSKDVAINSYNVYLSEMRRSYMEVINYSKKWNVLTKTYVDTVCKDSSTYQSSTNIRYTDKSNCNNPYSVGNLITYARFLKKSEISSFIGVPSTDDTSMIYWNRNDVQRPPGITISWDLKKGSSRHEHENYLIFQNANGDKKVVQVQIVSRDGSGYNRKFYLTEWYDL